MSAATQQPYKFVKPSEHQLKHLGKGSVVKLSAGGRKLGPEVTLASKSGDTITFTDDTTAQLSEVARVRIRNA